MSQSLGDQLLEIVSTARAELVLIAPFVKANALRRVLEDVPPTVKTTVVTRWRVEEISAGVSDLEVWDVLEGGRSGSLLLHPTLHAKYYRSDYRCWIGSANITGKALGWSAKPNVELMVEAEATDEILQNFEDTVLSRASPATASLVEELRDLVDLLPRATELQVDVLTGKLEVPTAGPWMPSLRQPSQLYTAYRGNGDRLTTESLRAAMLDLAAVEPPFGLDEAAFNAVVGSTLLQSEVMSRLDPFLSEPRRFGSVRQHLRTLTPELSIDEASHQWQTLLRWLLYFLPARYEMQVPNYTEVIKRIR